MRPLECEITDQQRSELIDALLDRREKLSILRKKIGNELTEEWKFANDWFQLSKKGNENTWRMMFGTGIVGRSQLEETIEWFESRKEISWIWPPEGFRDETKLSR